MSIEDISPLENITKLQALYLNSNRIKDITPLIKNLEHGGFRPWESGYNTYPATINLIGNSLNLKSGSRNSNDLKKLVNSGVEVHSNPQRLLVNPFHEGDKYITGKLSVATKGIRVEAFSLQPVNYGENLILNEKFKKIGGIGPEVTDQNGKFSVEIPQPQKEGQIIRVDAWGRGGIEEIYVQP